MQTQIPQYRLHTFGIWLFYNCGKSLIYKLKSKGPEIEPCGIPIEQVWTVNRVELDLTHCSLCLRYERNQTIASSEKLNVFSLLRRISWLSIKGFFQIQE